MERCGADAATPVQGRCSRGKRLVDAAALEPKPFDGSAELRAAAQVELVETLLATLREAAAARPTAKNSAKQERSRIVKIAEDHALACRRKPVRPDLCRATRVGSARSSIAFKQTMGLTPVAYLARLRLHRVRRRAAQPGAQLTHGVVVALDWGFWHFRRLRARLQRTASASCRRRRAPRSRRAGAKAGPLPGRNAGRKSGTRSGGARAAVQSAWPNSGIVPSIPAPSRPVLVEMLEFGARVRMSRLRIVSTTASRPQRREGTALRDTDAAQGGHGTLRPTAPTPGRTGGSQP